MYPNEQVPLWVFWGTTAEEVKKARVDTLLTLDHLWAEPKVLETKVVKKKKQRELQNNGCCAFCINNGRFMSMHDLKHCPVLRGLQCQNCGKNGHTIRYCPQKKIITPEDLAGEQ